MEQQPEGVVITLLDVYNVSQKTHEAVKDLGPRVGNVEKTAGDALALARQADERSKNSERFLKGFKTIGGSVLGGTILAVITDWIARHVH